MNLKVGDAVKITKVNQYRTTEIGSEGVVVEINTDFVDVDFYKVTGRPSDVTRFPIRPEHLQRLPISDSPLWKALA